MGFPRIHRMVCLVLPSSIVPLGGSLGADPRIRDLSQGGGWRQREDESRFHCCVEDSVLLARFIVGQGFRQAAAGTAFRGTKPGPAGIRVRVEMKCSTPASPEGGGFFLRMNPKSEN